MRCSGVPAVGGDRKWLADSQTDVNDSERKSHSPSSTSVAGGSYIRFRFARSEQAQGNGSIPLDRTAAAASGADRAFDEGSGDVGLLRARVNGGRPDCVPLNLGRKRADVQEVLRLHKLGYLLKAKFHIAAGNKIANLCAGWRLLDLLLDLISDHKLLKQRSSILIPPYQFLNFYRGALPLQAPVGHGNG